MLVINLDNIEWQEFYPGVMRRALAQDATIGRRLDLVRVAPGTKFPRHRHPEYEWIYVLRGVFADEHGKYPNGTFMINEQGSEHSPFTEGGCEFLLFWCGRHERI